MPVKLNSSGGGSVTLTTPSTASDFTATFPANTGNVVTTGSNAAVTPAMLSIGAPSWNSSGDLQFNSGYGSVVTAYGCRAWVNFNGTGTVAIRASGNVISITDNGTGDYTVVIDNDMPDANYAFQAIAQRNTGGTNIVVAVGGATVTQTAGTFRILAFNFSGVNEDPLVVMCSVFR
jgi:hypothetical protein